MTFANHRGAPARSLTFTLCVDLENDAFAGNEAGPELARILRELADRLEFAERRWLQGWAPPVLDANGNTVGQAEFAGGIHG